jgi:hypothetical protein
MLVARVHVSIDSHEYFGTGRKLASYQILLIMILTKCPGHETRESLANAPPSGEKRKDMLLVRGQILQEDGNIEHQVPASTEGEQSSKGAERNVVWSASGVFSQSGSS